MKKTSQWANGTHFCLGDKMDIKRFFVFETPADGCFTLKGAEFHHAIKVSRLREGYKIIICNNSNIDYYCTIQKIHKDCCVAKIDVEKRNEAYDDTNITLYLGVCKELDTVVQKAVEMGVKTVVPFYSQHSNISTLNVERLNKIIMESTKQCGRPNLMTITDLVAFDDALNIATSSNEKTVLFYEFERLNKVCESIDSETQSLAIFIGSEGGFALEEIEKAKQKGVYILTLGKRILRVQTAVVAALALCLQGLDRL